MFFLARIGLDWDTRAPFLLRPNDTPALGPPRLAHLKAHEYVEKKWVTQDQFDRYFKFTIVRNPWDRTASFYRFLGYDRWCSFSRFVRSYLPGKVENNHWFFLPQVDYLYRNGGQLLVDFVGRYESLTKDFATACQHLNIAAAELPHANNRQKKGPGFKQWLRRRPVPYTQMYDSRTRSIVAKLYEADVDAFKYVF